MREIWLIRHAKTYGNTLGRYIGTTDEPLCEEGREELLKKRYPKMDRIYRSPLLRCAETSALLFPGVPERVVSGFRECDFGAFENKNYRELSDNPDYQSWIDSGGTLPFPGGESREAFEKRCVKAFEEALAELGREEEGFRAAFVVHGGTIMSILSACAVPKRDYYDWQVKNAEGWKALWNGEYEGGIKLYEISHIGSDSGLHS